MSERTPVQPSPTPPSKHRLAITVWVAVVPTLAVLQLVLADFLEAAPQHSRPLATLAVPIVVYVLMPPLLRYGERRVGERR